MKIKIIEVEYLKLKTERLSKQINQLSYQVVDDNPS